jgi:hypothetical protein
MAEPGTESQSIQIDEDSQNAKSSKPKAIVERVPGRSAFPVARVQKILKADKVICLVYTKQDQIELGW